MVVNQSDGYISIISMLIFKYIIYFLVLLWCTAKAYMARLITNILFLMPQVFPKPFTLTAPFVGHWMLECRFPKLTHYLNNFMANNMVLGRHSSLWPKVTTLERSHRGYSRSEALHFIVAKAHSFLKTHYIWY